MGVTVEIFKLYYCLTTSKHHSKNSVSLYGVLLLGARGCALASSGEVPIVINNQEVEYISKFTNKIY